MVLDEPCDQSLQSVLFKSYSQLFFEYIPVINTRPSSWQVRIQKIGRPQVMARDWTKDPKSEHEDWKHLRSGSKTGKTRKCEYVCRLVSEKVRNLLTNFKLVSKYNMADQADTETPIKWVWPKQQSLGKGSTRAVYVSVDACKAPHLWMSMSICLYVPMHVISGIFTSLTSGETWKQGKAPVSQDNSLTSCSLFPGRPRPAKTCIFCFSTFSISEDTGNGVLTQD